MSLDIIADAACLSKFHFSRAFKSITGDKVLDYVRRRRITQSANDLISTDESILQIAINYQFDSQESYTRSFKGVYTITPNRYRKNGLNIQAYTRNELSPERLHHLQHNISITPEIVSEPERKLVGLHCKTSSVQNNIPPLWKVFRRRQREISQAIDSGLFGISGYSDFKLEQYDPSVMLDKWATVEVSAYAKIPEDMIIYNLRGGAYARFMHKGGKKNIQMSFEYAYSVWLTNSIYEIDDRDHFEHYPKEYKGPEDPASELFFYIPIKLK